MMKKILSIIGSVIKNIFLVILCFLAFIVISSRFTGGESTILGYQLKAVLSGSMEPTFHTGSVIAIKLGANPSSYEKGDIVTFHMDNKLITHRISAVHNKNGEISYKTKGDNNDAPDLWTVYPQNIIGNYSNFTIPYVGYALNFVSSKTGSALLLVVPGILLTLSALRNLLHLRREFEQKTAG
ncbi:signal peptidase I SipW [Gottfriedia luciferensis]|uniref:signal peptidase I SipW n=1 Tax=Gottfriedia luciferensis TaxID=178774 RepID=UPI001F380B90|nr:signal peptidase I [Gottfriedia luciferensis]